MVGYIGNTKLIWCWHDVVKFKHTTLNVLYKNEKVKSDILCRLGAAYKAIANKPMEVKQRKIMMTYDRMSRHLHIFYFNQTLEPM